MTDELDDRLGAAGSTPTPPPDPRFVARLETTLRVAAAGRAPVWWRQPKVRVGAAFAAAALAVIVAVVSSSAPRVDVDSEGGIAGAPETSFPTPPDTDEPATTSTTEPPTTTETSPTTTTPDDETVATDDSTTTAPSPSPTTSLATAPSTTVPSTTVPTTTVTSVQPQETTTTTTTSTPTRPKVSVDATRRDGGVVVEWVVSDDVDVAGWRIIRRAESRDESVVRTSRDARLRRAVDASAPPTRTTYVVHALDAEGNVIGEGTATVRPTDTTPTTAEGRTRSDIGPRDPSP